MVLSYNINMARTSNIFARVEPEVKEQAVACSIYKKVRGRFKINL
jgi:hypothetical protein